MCFLFIFSQKQNIILEKPIKKIYILSLKAVPKHSFRDLIVYVLCTLVYLFLLLIYKYPSLPIRKIALETYQGFLRVLPQRKVIESTD